MSLTNNSATRWWQALNPAIYLVSILPGVAVWLLAETSVDAKALCLATFAVVLIQHGINLLNDAKDWQLGADTHKFDSWVRVHGGHASKAFTHGVISLAAGGALGLFVLLSYERLWILSFALPLVVLGILYNSGQRPLSYTAAGEWVTALCYGPGVYGGLWFVSGQGFSWSVILGMAAFAAFATALLFSHQPPQIETDRRAGKYSFAVRHGALKTYRAARIFTSSTLLLLALVYWSLWQQKGWLIAASFSISAAVIILWIYQVCPNPKRIMLSTSLVFLVGVLITLYENVSVHL